MNLKTASEILTVMETLLCGSERNDDNKNYFDAVNIAKDAMSYRKFTKPLEQEKIPFSSYKRAGICPRCGGIVTSQQDYCDVCGQALDWRSNE